MIEVMKNIYSLINDAHEYATYNGQAPQETTLADGSKIPTPFPYVTYKFLPITPTESNRDDYTLEVSCWDKSESTSHARVVLIAEAVRKALLQYREVDEYNLIMTDRPSLGYIPDPDELIKRYDVTTVLRTYRR